MGSSPSSAPGLQPTLCAPPGVTSAQGKHLPALVPWSACQLRVAILTAATGEGVMLLRPPAVVISHRSITSLLSTC